MLQFLKKFRLLFLKIWIPISICIILTIGNNLLTLNPPFSQSTSPKNTQTQQSKEIPVIYQALAEDIIQIFKWMEIPSTTPVELLMYISGYQSDSDQVFFTSSAFHRGLPSVTDRKYVSIDDTTFDNYLSGLEIIIDGIKSPRKKTKIHGVYIKPSKTSDSIEAWYDNFSAIKFIDYLSKGSDKPERIVSEYDSDSGLYQTINLKQKYFKSSKFKKYMVSIESSPTGAWRLPNGKKFPKERNPYISLKIDPTE